MRAKRFFNKLNSELNESLPKMSEELKNAPIPPCQTLEVVEEKQKTFDFTHFFTPKRLTAFATVFAIVFIAVFSTLTVTGAFGKRSDSVVVKMEINPSFELLLNEDMKVEKVVSNNADGDVILAEEGFIDLIVGKNATEAIEIIVQKAADYGFIDYNNLGTAEDYNKITVSFSGNKSKLPKNLVKEVKNTLNECLLENGLYVYVDAIVNESKQYEKDLAKINEKTQLYFQTVTQESAQFKEYFTELIFDYCNVLLSHSLEQYYLLKEIEALNEEIKNAQESVLQFSYWLYSGNEEAVIALCDKMNKKLEYLYSAFGVDLREKSITSELLLSASTAIYTSDIDIEGLAELCKIGVNENLFDSENQILGDFILISAEDFIGDVIEFYSDLITDGTSTLTQSFNLLITKLEAIRKSASIREDIQVITSEQYAEFLNRIGK